VRAASRVAGLPVLAGVAVLSDGNQAARWPRDLRRRVGRSVGGLRRVWSIAARRRRGSASSTATLVYAYPLGRHW